jgi:hypothetical protein
VSRERCANNFAGKESGLECIGERDLKTETFEFE